MAVGRIPGPLGMNQLSGKTVNVPQPLVGASPPVKQVPVGVSYLIWYPPPRLAQGEIYKGKEATYGCWATTAEMIVKWRNESASFVRPSFENEIPGDDLDEKVKYFEFVERWLADRFFEKIPGASSLTWDTRLLASTLKQSGPLYCVGSFWVDGTHNMEVGGVQHAIAVFGAQDDIVYYRDPWDGEIKTMATRGFDKKLLRASTVSMYRYAHARVPGWTGT